MKEHQANRRAALDAAAKIYSGVVAAGYYGELDRQSRPVAAYEEVLKLATRLEEWLNNA